MSANLQDCPGTPIDCDLSAISPIDVFFRLVQVDENGCPALNTVTVEPGDVPCETWITCDTAATDFRALVKKLITTDENGCWALRIIESNPA